MDKQVIFLRCEATNNVFQLESSCAKLSAVFCDMFEMCGNETKGGVADIVIPIFIREPILLTIIEWCRAKLTEPDDNMKSKIIIEETTDIGFLLEVLLATDFLGIQQMTATVAQRIAEMLQSTNIQDIRLAFNESNNFDVDEEIQIIEENLWIPFVDDKYKQGNEHQKIVSINENECEKVFHFWVMNEILTRLTTTTLGRVRQVSKSWNDHATQLITKRNETESNLYWNNNPVETIQNTHTPELYQSVRLQLGLAFTPEKIEVVGEFITSLNITLHPDAQIESIIAETPNLTKLTCVLHSSQRGLLSRQHYTAAKNQARSIQLLPDASATRIKFLTMKGMTATFFARQLCKIMLRSPNLTDLSVSFTPPWFHPDYNALYMLPFQFFQTLALNGCDQLENIVIDIEEHQQVTSRVSKNLYMQLGQSILSIQGENLQSIKLDSYLQQE